MKHRNSLRAEYVYKLTQLSPLRFGFFNLQPEARHAGWNENIFGFSASRDENISLAESLSRFTKYDRRESQDDVMRDKSAGFFPLFHAERLILVRRDSLSHSLSKKLFCFLEKSFRSHLPRRPRLIIFHEKEFLLRFRRFSSCFQSGLVRFDRHTAGKVYELPDATTKCCFETTTESEISLSLHQRTSPSL